MPEPSFGLVESFALGFPHVGWGCVSPTLPGLRVSSYLMYSFVFHLLSRFVYSIAFGSNSSVGVEVPLSAFPDFLSVRDGSILERSSSPTTTSSTCTSTSWTRPWPSKGKN